MGLAVSVGAIAYLNIHDQEGADGLRKSLAKANSVLVENGLPEHTEPEVLPPVKSRGAALGFPYSFPHYLRRFAAHASTKPNWKPKPFPASSDPVDDPVVIDELTMFRSHLICHSDCEGFYLPVDFAEPLFASENRVPGGMLGSSQGLMRELISVAPFLDIKLSDGQLSDTEAARINETAFADGPFRIELMVWLTLFEAARLSIKHGAAISFG
ncbi:hypothetical protein [Zavarzinella formosa]|uniref:hypothetical protein n=1 Tax=Zavarzinella formosa TaxID=360055 RepID=UPI000315F1C5|nr:hypothetical protein [Zavarzinella formosa]